MYVVVCANAADWNEIHNYIVNENEIDGIPNRKIECTNINKTCDRIGSYEISDEEAEQLKNHSKIIGVNIDEEYYDGTYKGKNIFPVSQPKSKTSRYADDVKIGRDLGTFKNTEVIKPLSGRKLGSKLSTYDVYVSGTIADPGPNHILEALSCRLPPYVLDSGGGSVEFAGIDHSFSSFKGFISKITKEISKNSFIPGDWQNCIESYADIIEDLA